MHAHTWVRWSGNPAVLGCHALRPVALRPRLSNGFALVTRSVSGGRPIGVYLRTRRTDRIPRSGCPKDGPLGTLCLVVCTSRPLCTARPGDAASNKWCNQPRPKRTSAMPVARFPATERLPAAPFRPRGARSPWLYKKIPSWCGTSCADPKKLDRQQSSLLRPSRCSRPAVAYRPISGRSPRFHQCLNTGRSRPM